MVMVMAMVVVGTSHLHHFQAQRTSIRPRAVAGEVVGRLVAAAVKHDRGSYLFMHGPFPVTAFPGFDVRLLCDVSEWP